MKPSYTFIDHTADVLFKATGGTLEELFVQCGLAVEDTQVNLATIEQKEVKEFTVKHKTVEGLLFDFIDDLIFYKDSELLIFNKFDISITKNEEYELTCKAYGEKLDHAKHEPEVDVKAVTMHLFEVKEVDGGWEATVLLDI